MHPGTWGLSLFERAKSALACVRGNVFSSELSFPVIPGGGTLEEPVEISFARRSAHTEDGFPLRSRFPFGFSDRRIQVTLRREVIVHPALDPQPGFEALPSRLQGEMKAPVRGRGHDFYRIRPYEPLESARNVDWKATAHTGELQVREFSQEPLSGHVRAIILGANRLHHALGRVERAFRRCEPRGAAALMLERNLRSG